MPRWETDAVGRLERAALELFSERGYDGTTVAHIAQRADLQERSFYRHFTDKREVLFGGRDELERRLLAAIEQTPSTTKPLETLIGALREAAAVFRPKQLLRTRDAVIAANPALRERELIKLESMSVAMRTALVARGVELATARITADLLMAIWRSATEEWLQQETTTFDAEVTAAMQQVRRITRANPPTHNRAQG